MTLDAYRPSDAWYLRPPSRMHGPAHAARTLVLAGMIAQSMSGAGHAVDLVVVRWAASLHDVRRQDDGRDPGHGQRAAEWLLSTRPAPLACLPASRLEQIAACCGLHDLPDVPDGMSRELACLKDADALDRVRLGETAHTLRCPPSAGLRDAAAMLFGLSQVYESAGDWQSVRSAAQRLDCWDQAG